MRITYSTRFLFFLLLLLIASSCSTTYKTVGCAPAHISVLVIDYKTDTAFIVKKYTADGTFTQLIDSSVAEPIYTRDSSGILVPSDTVVICNVYNGYDYTVTTPSTGNVHTISAIKDNGQETMRVKCKNGDCPTCAANLVSYAIDGQVVPAPIHGYWGIVLPK